MDNLQYGNHISPSSFYLEKRKICNDEFLDQTRGENGTDATGSGSFSKPFSSSKDQIPFELLMEEFAKAHRSDALETTYEDSELAQMPSTSDLDQMPLELRMESYTKESIDEETKITQMSPPKIDVHRHQTDILHRRCTDIDLQVDQNSSFDQRRHEDEGKQSLIDSADSVAPSIAQTHNSSKLDFRFVSDGFLFDRDDEIKSLHEAFHRSCSPISQPELVLISGISGTGKTALANQLQLLVKSHVGYFVRGKFDQINNPQPYDAFVSAFTELIGLVVKRGRDVVAQLRNLILKNIGSDIQLLVDTFPALTEVVETTQSENANAVGASRSQLQNTLVQSRLRNAVAKLIELLYFIESSPIVIVIDDLQWGDSGSLDLLESLVSNQKIQGFVMVGICRSDEVSFDHNFAGTLRKIEDNKKTKISHIQVNNLSLESANDVVSHMLHLPKMLCKPLTSVLVDKTAGNVLFFLQLLQKFCDDKILIHDPSKGIWTWDEEKLNSEKCYNVVDLVSQKIMELPDETRTVLMSAACLGVEFSKSLLSKILVGCNVSLALQIAVKKKIIIYNKQLKNYTFHHDRYQQAAYSLISEKEKPLVHITIGRRLYGTLQTEKLSTHIFLVVDQMIRGISLLKDQKEKNELAALCIAAGASSIRSSSFMKASLYFWQGIDLLERRTWRREYDLTLELYCAAAETEFCNANFEKMDLAIEGVLQNVTSPIDQVRVYSAKVNFLVACGQLQEAIDVGLTALELFGVKFPKKIGKTYILKEIFKTKYMLRRKKRYDLLIIPDMEDPNIAAAMGLLNHLMRSSFSQRDELFPLIATQIVQLSLEHGFCAISALGFCAYSGVLLKLEEYDSAHYYAELALSILNRYRGKGVQWLARVHMMAHGMCLTWKNPLQKSLDPLINAELKGMETGDIEYSILSARQYCLNSFLAGVELSIIVQKLTRDIEKMEKLKQIPVLLAGKVQLKMINNLMENSPDPLDLASSTILEDQKNNTSFMGTYGLWRLILAYSFGNIEAAIEASKIPQMSRGMLSMTAIAGVKIFYIALTLLEAAKESKKKKKKYLSLSKKMIKKLKKYSEISPSNCANKYFLVEAELAALHGEKFEDIVDKYNRSIIIASSEGFVQEQALAYERASIFLRSRGDNQKAKKYFDKAIDLYTRWGANGKITHMLGTMKTF